MWSGKTLFVRDMCLFRRAVSERVSARCRSGCLTQGVSGPLIKHRRPARGYIGRRAAVVWNLEVGRISVSVSACTESADAVCSFGVVSV